MKLGELYNKLSAEYGSSTGEMVFTFSDKGSMHSYIELYERYFEPYRNSVSLLEIGIMTGGSLLLWQKYFQKYQLFGLDISSSWNQVRPFQAGLESDSNIKLLFGYDSKDETTISMLQSHKFNFIIDDGDHSIDAQLKTFKNYWPLLESGGSYFVEDVASASGIVELKNFVNTYSGVKNIEHYQGFKLGRGDDQILIITRE